MSIDDSKCEICGADLAMDNYFYVYAGRLQQGPQSDKKSMLEYTLCTNCYTQIKAELMVAVQRRKSLTEKK
jgi:hypothetical protein